MSKKLEEIINVALELSLEDRAQLAGTLLFSLDEPSESEVEHLWLQEAERRLQDYREGGVQRSPGGRSVQASSFPKLMRNFTNNKKGDILVTL